jgi:hypothetical protein
MYNVLLPFNNKKNKQNNQGVFGGIHGVSSAVILFVPKLRLVSILWQNVGILEKLLEFWYASTPSGIKREWNVNYCSCCR